MNCEIVVDTDGTVRAIYNDDVAAILRAVGTTTVQRASHVEPCGDGWAADLSPVGGPTLPRRRRDQALEAEVDWLLAHNIPQPQTR